MEVDACQPCTGRGTCAPCNHRCTTRRASRCQPFYLVHACPTWCMLVLPGACLSYLCMLVLLVVTVACTGPSTARSECMHSPSTWCMHPSRKRTWHQAHAPLCDTLSALLLRARRDGETAPRAVLAMLANLTPNLTLTLTLALILTLTLTPGDGAHGAGRGGTGRRRGRGRRSHSTDGQGRPPGALTRAERGVLFPTCLDLTRTFTLTSSPTRTLALTSNPNPSRQPAAPA